MTEWDVIVCGGGTAGAAAAIAAGRTGAKTLVVEQLGALGGTQTQGWVTPLMPNHLGPFKLSRGVNIDIIEAQAKVQPPGDIEHGDEWYDPVGLAGVLDRLAGEAGVTCLFDATLFEVQTANGRISSIKVMTRSGPLELRAKCFIDCTGDATLSFLAGAEIMSGNDDGVHQPMTLRFIVSGVEEATLRTNGAEILRINTPDYVESGYGEAKNGAMEPWIREAVDQGVLQEDDLGYFQFFTINGRPGDLAFNCPRISGLDPLDAFEMSRAYQVGRAKIARIAEFLRRWVPGFSNSFVSGIAPLMGIRESRRVVGEYVLTEDDHQACRKFEDVVARNRYPVDIHLKVGIDYRKFPPGEWHDIPYRSIVAKGFQNLWVAGRCMSATFVAQSATRIQSVCRACGEAAGVAAFLACSKSLSAQEVPYNDLADKLDLSLPNEHVTGAPA